MAEMKDVFEKAESKMKKAVGHLQEEYAAIRAGRANPAVLDRIMVNYYDTPTPINQLAAVAVTEARVLTIQPWDTSVLRGIEKAIQTSDLGVNPQNDGKMILPAAERRAPTGFGQGDQQAGGGGKGRGALYPPGRHGEAEGHEKEVRDNRG